MTKKFCDNCGKELNPQSDMINGNIDLGKMYNHGVSLRFIRVSFVHDAALIGSEPDMCKACVGKILKSKTEETQQ